MVLKHGGQHLYLQFQHSKVLCFLYFLQLKLILNQSNPTHNFMFGAKLILTFYS